MFIKLSPLHVAISEFICLINIINVFTEFQLKRNVSHIPRLL